jgi:hypothetical protein
MRRDPLRRLSYCLLLLLTAAALFWGCSDDSTSDPVTTDDTGGTSPADTSATLPDTDPTTAADVDEDATADADDAQDADDAPDTANPNDPGPKPAHQREEKAMAAGTLLAGSGLGYVNGPVGVSQAGYGARGGQVSSVWSGIFQATQGFYGYLSVKAVALEVDGERLILMKIPTMSSESLFIDATVKKMKDLYGLDLSGRIVTGATHSHHTNGRYLDVPELFALLGTDLYDPEVVDLLATEFARTAKRALDDLGPAEWAFGYQDDWDPDNRVSRDRRSVNNPTYPKDPRLSLLAFRRPDGTPMATLINFGMHGTVFGSENRLLSEDSAGGLELKFEEHFFQQEGKPILGMFIQSGGGDASPAGDHLGHPEEARIEMIGETAAPKVYSLYKTLTWTADATLAVRSRRIDLRYQWMGYDEYPEFKNANGKPYYWGGLQCADPEPGETLEGKPKNCMDLGNILKRLGGGVPHGVVHQAYLTTVRLGDVFLVSIPGEPAYSTIKYLRESVASRAEGAMQIMAFGYSQDHLLYFTHPDDWFLGDYESNMSLWGPLGGKYMIDRQMELVDDMLAGFNGPVFYEESPSLILPSAFTPRGFERSEPVNTVALDVDASYNRTDDVRFAFGGGDSSVGSPLVKLQHEVSDGVFVDVPSPAGFPGRAYDNSRYYMITLYLPNPPVTEEVLDARFHRWQVEWQVPVDFPAGRYRLLASGPYWTGSSPSTYEVPSATFSIGNSPTATLTATRDGDTLQLRWTNDPVAIVRGDEYWPSEGWRLLDNTVRHDAVATVRAPLLLTLTVGGQAVDGDFTATFDPATSAHTFDLSTLGVDTAGQVITVSAAIATDHDPAPLTTTLNP